MHSNGMEVRVAWGDCTLFCRHFSGVRSISVGGRGADIALPIFPAEVRHEVILPYHLKNDEEARVQLRGGLLDLFIRPLDGVPRARAGEIVDLKSVEAMGFLLALMISALLGQLMNIYVPSKLMDLEEMTSKPVTKMRVIFRERPTAPVASAAESSGPPTPQVQSKSGGSQKSVTKSVRPLKGKPQPKTHVFASAGMIEKLQKSLTGGQELTELANGATGKSGKDSAGSDGPALKSTGDGLGKGTIWLGAGPGDGGRNGVGHFTGGLGRKGATPIQVSEQGASAVAGMDREAIRRVIREHLKEIRSCYERELQSSPDLYGKIILEWEISEGGRVTMAKAARDEIGNGRVASCLTARLKSWKFPDPPLNQVGRVTYPFVFSSR